MGDPNYEERKRLKNDAETERLRGQVAYAKRQADSEELMTLCTETLHGFLRGQVGLVVETLGDGRMVVKLSQV